MNALHFHTFHTNYLIMPPKRKTSNCLSCGNRFSSIKHRIEHLFQDSPGCKASYICCESCKNYAGTDLSHLKKHFNSSPTCKANHAMINNPSSVPLPSSTIDIDELNRSSKKQKTGVQFQIDDSSDYVGVDFGTEFLYNNSSGEQPKMTNVYIDKNSSSLPTFVQFGSFQETYEASRPREAYIDPKEDHSKIVGKLHDRAALKRSRSSIKYSSVRCTLPGFTDDSNELILHTKFLRKINERDDTLSLTDSENESFNSMEEDQTSEDGRTRDDEDDEDDELIRLIHRPADIEAQTNPEVANNNVENVLNGREVRFPVNTEGRFEDAREVQQEMKSHFENLKFTKEDDCLLELYKILQTANVPKNMFNKIVKWSEEHKEIVGKGRLRKREQIMKHWFKQIGGNIFTPIPAVTNVPLPSGNTVNMTTFSLRNYILDLITDDMFHHKNLLLDKDDPCKIPDGNIDLGEPNTGSWFREAALRMCTTDKHLLFNIGFFIDELKLDKFGRLGSEVVLGSYQGFVKDVRNMEQSWFPLGFVENQSNFKDQKGYVKEKKMNDYHAMIAHIFREFRSIIENGGIKVDLDYGTGVVHKDIIIVPVIQYIIGDCKGNDVHCGRKGTHVLTTPRLCRDCNIPSSEADNVNYRCNMASMSDFQNKTKQEMDAMSHYNINNAFHALPFGGCPHNIHCSCPPEILHNFQLGKCNDLGRDLSFTDAANEHISTNFTRVYPFLKCQSERNVPSIRPFRDGISSVKSLKAKERYARVFAVYLSMMNPYLVKKLEQYKKAGQDNANVKNSTHSIKQYVTVLEDTLMIHEWLKSGTISRTLVDDLFESPAYKRIVQYSQLFKDIVVLDKYACQTTKFHQLLHIVFYILRYGAPCNFDGSIGELMGKHYAKDMSKSTNKDKDTMNMNIAIRISEKKTTERLLKLREGQNKASYGRKPFRMKREGGTTNKTFTIIKTDVNIRGTPDAARQFGISIEWKKGTKKPITDFPRLLLLAVVNRLYHWNPVLGGILTPNSVVKGFTDYKPDPDGDLIFRANPHFRKKGEWFDWAYFNWGHDIGYVPARILMFLDLSDCTISHDAAANTNHDMVQNHIMADVPDIHKLSKDKFAVIQSAKTKRALHTDENTKLTDRHFDSKISFWVEMEQDYRLVPLSTLSSQCFAYDTIPYSDDDTKDNTALVIRPMSEWSDILFKEAT